MKLSKQTDYSILDRSEICTRIFYPRPEVGSSSKGKSESDILIPVAGQAQIGAKFHVGNKAGSLILFFHGNGEIAADYNDVAFYYRTMGINFVVVDYRGYGRSTGRPTVSSMMGDCHGIFEFVNRWRHSHGYHGSLIVMGRSLGSASALELASVYPSQVDGLIIESGFAFTEPLLQLLGIHTRAIGFEESTSFGNLFKAASYQGPALFIHAEYDDLIPYSFQQKNDPDDSKGQSQ
jgi:pimeloyl-ACP methyl ester carboxylesterase